MVEVCHSWFNRFRKLLVRYEKLERSFVALNHIAAAIIAFRKVELTVNIVYGYLLGQNSAAHHSRRRVSGGDMAAAMGMSDLSIDNVDMDAPWT